MKMKSVKIAIFASGSGSNAQNIVNHFNSHNNIEISLILSNKNDAFVLERAKRLGIKSLTFTREELNSTSRVEDILKENSIDLIILAGFLLKIPVSLLEKYPSRIINIHPALLPLFGGKGMYGMNVHKAVIESGQKESGITIHLVDEHYDHGSTLFQAKCVVEDGDTPDSLAQKIHNLEGEYFPKVIETFVETNLLGEE